jgi:hypothetical protein
MTDRKIPSRGQTATFSVNGVKRGDSMLLLYPDELTVVNTRSIGTWVYVLVPAIYLAVHFYLFHTIGWGLVAIWYAAGWWVWQALGRRLAARKGANWLGIRKMTVTTADGTEYKFDGLMEQWHDHLARALTAHRFG